jgi:hypothetical protein
MLSKEELNDIFEYKNGDLIRKKTRKIIKSPVNGYFRATINKKIYLAHRIIFMMHHGFVPKIIDHINGNRSDNRIDNLRVASNNQNAWNRIANKNSTNPIKGIRLHKDNKWEARIQVNKKSKYLGVFDDIELAELVVVEARNKYHKEFANNGY